MPILLSTAVLLTGPRASTGSKDALETVLCFFWGITTAQCLRVSALLYLVEVLTLAGAVWLLVSRSTSARQAASCSVIFAVCYVLSTVAAMLLLQPVLFVLGVLLYGFA